MKKIILFTISLFLLPYSFTNASEDKIMSSITNLPNVPNWQIEEHLQKLSPIRLLPTNTFYFAITWKENIEHLLKANASEKAFFDTILAGKRIKEAYILEKKGDLEASLKTIERYQKRMEILEKELNNAQKHGDDVIKTLDLLADDLFRHQDLMSQIASNVPSGEKGKFVKQLNLANNHLVEVTKLLKKGRPDQAERLLSRYKETSKKQQTLKI